MLKISDIKHGMRKEPWYYDLYDRHLKDFKNDSNVFEIGVQTGESLEMWRKVFPTGNIVGLDIDETCGKPEGTKVYIGDQCDKATLEKIVNENGDFDVIIDDGGHTMEQQITSFKHLIGHVKQGGIYVIEDLHTSYWPQFDGGYKKQNTTVEFIKDFIDSINHQSVDHPRAGNLRQKLEDIYPIYAVHIYPSIIFIEKR